MNAKFKGGTGGAFPILMNAAIVIGTAAPESVSAISALRGLLGTSTVKKSIQTATPERPTRSAVNRSPLKP